MRRAALNAIRATACLVLLLLTIEPALAGSIVVNPIRLTFSASRTAGVLTVRNTGAEPSVVQLEVMSWSQQDGKEVLVPTKELLAAPPIFTVPAGGSQIVRVGLRKAADPRSEVTYRVIMQEVPPPPKPGFQGLQVALRLSVPVFVTPPIAAAPEIQWSATRTTQGDLSIGVSNDGNAHIQITGLRLSVDGARLSPQQQPRPEYVLPGQRVSWTLRFDSTPAVATTLHLVAQTDAGERQADVVVSAP
jgi:fimbrial chaperone protein